MAFNEFRMLFDIAFYIGFVMVVCFFIVRWRENQFNLEENEHSVEKLTVKFRLPTGTCQHFKSLSRASMKKIYKLRLQA